MEEKILAGRMVDDDRAKERNRERAREIER
jgi:hypothetical protein